MEYNNEYINDEDLSQMSGESEPNQIHGQSFPEDNDLKGDVELVEAHTRPSHPVVDEEELLAAQAAADEAVAQQEQNGQPGGVFANVGQGLVGKNRDMMMQYWQETINSIEHDEHDFKNHHLPLARIKKVMKTDEEVRMISAEAPILFAKGCDVFITELTMRAWIHAEENKRRTLQKLDIAAALTKSDMFDFLIDVVPREDEKPKKAYSPSSRPTSFGTTPTSQPLLLHQSVHGPNARLPPGAIPGRVPALGRNPAVGTGAVNSADSLKEEALEDVAVLGEQKNGNYNFDTYSNYDLGY